jgi:hypothetical protein
MFNVGKKTGVVMGERPVSDGQDNGFPRVFREVFAEFCDTLDPAAARGRPVIGCDEYPFHLIILVYRKGVQHTLWLNLRSILVTLTDTIEVGFTSYETDHPDSLL